jgi:glycosyltransferase involved in cell wall biosynthesis
MLKSSKINFGVRIVTYPRPDGRTPDLLRKTIESVVSQSWCNWVIYLVGDTYQPSSEFDSFLNFAPSGKIKISNPDLASERFIFNDEKKKRYFGGICAANYCLDWMSRESVTHVAILDHDDIWLPNHLKTLSDAYEFFPDANFVYNAGTYCGSPGFPASNCLYQYDNLLPMGGSVLHSSVSWRLDKIPLRYSYSFEKNGDPVFGDIKMWSDMRSYFKSKNYKFVFTKKSTMIHDGT